VDYKLYFIGADGHIERSLDLQAADDVAAVGCAQRFRDGVYLELWQGRRKVQALSKSDAASGHATQAVKCHGDCTP